MGPEAHLNTEFESARLG